MKRNFRELIPLFAIALMIIGAVALLIVMNQDSSKKKTTVKSNKEKTQKVQEVEEKEDTSKEQSFIIDDEVKEENKVEDTKVEEKTETKVETKTETKTNTTNVKTSSKDSTYIQSMVNSIMNNAGVNMGSVETKPATQTNTNTNTNTFVNTVEKTQPVYNVNIEETKVQTQTQPQQTISQSYTQKATANAYVIRKAVTYGNYTIAVTSNNNLICYNTSTKYIISTDNIPSTVSSMQVYNDRLYIAVPTQEQMRVYTMYNGSLKKVAALSVGPCKNFVVTDQYAFVLREDERLYAYLMENGVIQPAQCGFTFESGGIESIVSAQGARVTVRTNTGYNYTYSFNGINFIR